VVHGRGKGHTGSLGQKRKLARPESSRKHKGGEGWGAEKTHQLKKGKKRTEMQKMSVLFVEMGEIVWGPLYREGKE